jgi:hypothetical protein
MKRLALSAVCMLCWASSAQAADLLSGTWTVGEGPSAQTYIFKVSGDRIIGIVCGPCNDASAVFRIEDGQILGADRASFVIRRAAGHERVEASLARNQLKLSGRPEGNSSAAPTALSLKRVIEDFELDAQPLPPTPVAARAGASKASSIEGHWVSVGRTAQQNWILKVQDGTVWGLVCGPCTPAVVAMVDAGRVDGDTVQFYINHIDTPPNAARRGIQRNVMRGKLPEPGNGNIMKFTWVAEQSPTQTGEIVMIGPIR